MNKIVFLLRALLFIGAIWGVASCSKEPFSIYPAPGPNTTYQEADILVITQHQLYILEHNLFYHDYHIVQVENGYSYMSLYFIFSTEGVLDLTYPTYMWAEALDTLDAIKFNWDTDESGYSMMRDFEVYYYHTSLSETALITAWHNLGFQGSEFPRHIRFVLKFYQPHSQTYYQTRPLTLHFEEPEGEPQEYEGAVYYRSYSHITYE